MREKNILTLIDKKYHIDDITKPLNFEDDSREFDQSGNEWWWAIYEIDGEYFKVWGLNEEMIDDCVKVTKRVKMEPVIYWEENYER